MSVRPVPEPLGGLQLPQERLDLFSIGVRDSLKSAAVDNRADPRHGQADVLGGVVRQALLERLQISD